MTNRQQYCNDFSNYPRTDAYSFDTVLVNGRGIYSDVRAHYVLLFVFRHLKLSFSG